MSSGNREIIRYLAQHKLVDCLVTTAGGIEEDFIKTHAPFFLADFRLDGAALRRKGINRIGNLLAPNERYIWFEEFFQPVLKELLDEFPFFVRHSWTAPSATTVIFSTTT